MCSRTEPFATLSNIKGRRPLRASSNGPLENLHVGVPQSCLSRDSLDSSDTSTLPDSEIVSRNTNHLRDSQTQLTVNNNVDSMKKYSPHSNGRTSPPTRLLSRPSAKRLEPGNDGSPRLSAESCARYRARKTESDDESESEEEIDVEGIANASQSRLYPNLDEFRNSADGEDDCGLDAPRSSPSSRSSRLSSFDESPGRGGPPTPRGQNGAAAASVAPASAAPPVSEEVDPPENASGIRRRGRLQKTVIGYNGERTLPPKSVEETAGGISSVLLLILLLSSLGLFYVFGWDKNSAPMPRRSLTEKGDLSKIFDALKASFPSQTKRSWMFFNAPLRRVLRDKERSEDDSVSP